MITSKQYFGVVNGRFVEVTHTEFIRQAKRAMIGRCPVCHAAPGHFCIPISGHAGYASTHRMRYTDIYGYLS